MEIFAPNAWNGVRDVLEVRKSVIYDPMAYGGPLDPQSKYWSDFGPFFGTNFESIFTRRTKNTPIYPEYVRTKLSRWLPRCNYKVF